MQSASISTSCRTGRSQGAKSMAALWGACPGRQFGRLPGPVRESRTGSASRQPLTASRPSSRQRRRGPPFAHLLDERGCPDIGVRAQCCGRQQRVEGLQDPLVLVGRGDMLQHRAGEALRLQLAAQQRRQETAQPVGLDRDRGQVQFAHELGDLAAQLGRFVDLVPLRGIVAQIADVVQPVAAGLVDEHRGHDRGVAGVGSAIGRVPPAAGADTMRRPEIERMLSPLAWRSSSGAS